MLRDILHLFASLSVGLAVLCLILFCIDFIRYLEYREDENTDTMKDLIRLPVFITMVLPLAGNFNRWLNLPMFQHALINTDSLLKQSGLELTITARQYMGCRLALGFIGIFLGILVGLSQPLLGIFMVVMLYFYPAAWLQSTRNKRHLSIQRALPNLLDLLTLSVEAGRDFLSSLRDILKRRKNDPLGEELRRTFQEIQLGKSRREALKELCARVQQPDLTGVMTAVIQADELGVSIGNILRIQGDQLRSKRFQRAEKLANEAPTKMLGPMVIFIFPAVFLILLAPIIMEIFAKGF